MDIWISESLVWRTYILSSSPLWIPFTCSSFPKYRYIQLCMFYGRTSSFLLIKGIIFFAVKRRSWGFFVKRSTDLFVYTWTVTSNWRNNIYRHRNACVYVKYYSEQRAQSCMNKNVWGQMCVLLESETKTIKKHHKLKPFHCSPLLSSPFLLPSCQYGVAIVREGKGISPSLQKTLIWLTHKRPSDHKSTDPVGPLCLVCLYMYTSSLWGFRTLRPFPFVFPLSLLPPPPPLPPPSTPLPLPFGVSKHLSTDMFWALEHPGARDPDRGRK